MAQLEFPSSPSVGQTYMAPGGKVWRYGGKGWICLVDSGSQIYYNATPPEDVAKYPLWVNTDTGDLMVFYQDIDSDQWIKIGTTGGGGGAGGGGSGATYLNDLNDVDTTGVGVGNVISWDGTNWTPSVPAGAGSIDNLTDVDTTTAAPSINDFLIWDSANWVPYTLVTTNWDTAYTHSQTTHAPTNADNTAANETSHANILKDNNTTPLTADWDVGAFDITLNTLISNENIVTSGGYIHVNRDNDLANATLYISRDAGYTGMINYRTDTLNRWLVGASDGGEGGSDVGSDYVIQRYNDSGVFQDTSLTITRSTGNIITTGTITANGVLLTGNQDLSSYGQKLTVEDEGSPLTTDAKKLNFAGTGVTVTEPVADEMLVTISGGGSALEVEDEGVSLSTAVTKINFAGTGVTATEPVADEILVTIAGGAGVSELDDLSDVDTSTTAPANGDILEYDGTNFVPVENTGGAGGSSSFTGLTDTPAIYTGQAGKTAVVNQDEDGLEFGTQGNIVYQDEVSCRTTITTTGTLLTAGNYTPVVMDTIDYNHGNGSYDTSTGEYTVPVAGRYLVNSQLFIGSGISSNTYGVSVMLNNSTYARLVDYQTGTTFCQFGGTCIVDAAAGDIITIRGYNGSGTDEALYTAGSSEEYCFMEIQLQTAEVILAPHGIDVGFSVNLGNVDQVITDTAPATVEVEWTEARYQKNCSYDFTNNRFVAPSAGIYQFGATLQLLDVAGTNFTVEIVTSKGTFTGHRVNVDNFTSFIGHANIYLDAGDTAYVTCYSSTDSSYSIRGFQNWSYFFGTKVSGTSTGVEYDSYDVSATAYLSATQAVVTANTYEKIEYDFIRHDQGGNFDTTNNRFVAPVDGVYHVATTTRFERSSGVSIRTALYKNGSNVGQLAHDTMTVTLVNKSQSLVGTTDIVLEAGDYIEVWAQSSNNTDGGYYGADNTSMYTHISVTLNRATTKAECSFNANRNGTDQTTTVSGWTKILLTNTEFNYGNSFDSVTNNRFVAPEDGRYIFNWSSGIEGLGTSSTRFVSALKLNDSLYYQGSRAAINTTESVHISSGSVILDLVKGDYAELWITQDESTTEVIRGESFQTYLSGYRLVTSQDTPKITSDLSDVSSTMPVTNDVLMYDGTVYEPTQVLNPTNVLYETTLTAASDTIDIPANLLGGARYTVEINSKATGTGNVCYVLVNGNTTIADYHSSVLYTSGATPTGTEYNYPYVTYLSDSDPATIQIELYCNGSQFSYTSRSNNFTAVADIVTRVASGWDVTNTVTSIDAIQLKCPASLQWDVGTTVKVINPTSNPITLAPHGVEHAFTAWQSGAQSIPGGGGFNTIVFDQVEDQTNLNFDTSTGKITIPTTGWWYIAGGTQLKLMGDGKGARTAITVNDVVAKGAPYSYAGVADATLWTHVSGQFYFNTGDVVEIQVGQLDTVARDTAGTQTATRFEGHMISGAHSGIEYDSYDVAWHVKFTTPTTLSPASTWYPCVDDGTRLDSGGNYDSTNSVYIIPEDGIYQLNYHMRVDGLETIGSYFESALFKNGVRMNPYQLDKKDGDHMNDVYATFGTSYVEELKAGDQIDVRVNSQSDTVFTIYGWFSGHIVKADSKAECSFKVHRNSVDQTGVVPSTHTVVDFTNAEWDKGNNFNLTSNQFVAPEKGRYIFDGGAGSASTITTDKSFYCSIYVNGTVVSLSEYDRNSLTSNVYRKVSAILDLEKSDVIDLRVWHDEATNEDIDGDPTVTYFSGYRLVSSQDLVQSTNDLADVYDTVPVTGDVLVHDGTKYEPTQILGGIESNFSTSIASTQTVSAALETKIDFNTIEHNINNDFDTGTNSYIAPESGQYEFHVMCTVENLTVGYVYCGFTINGVRQQNRTINDCTTLSATYHPLQHTAIIDLEKGDVIYAYLYTNTDASYTIRSEESRFTGKRIGNSIVLAPNGLEHSFSSYVSSEQSITSASTWTKVEFDSVESQHNVSYDTTNSQFVVPSSGRYHFTTNLYLGGTLTSGTNTISFYVNGALKKYGPQYNKNFTAPETTNYMMGMSADLELNAGDIVDVRIYLNGTLGTVKSSANTTWFTGHKISGTSTGVEHDSFNLFADVQQTGTQSSLAGSTYYKVQLDNVISDAGGNIDTTNDQFIAPVDGLYHIYGAVRWSNVPDQVRLITRHQINGVYSSILADRTTSQAAATNSIAAGFTFEELKAGDVVTLHSYHNNGSALDMLGGDNSTTLKVYLVNNTTKAESSFRAWMGDTDQTVNTGWTVADLTTTDYNIGNNFNTTLKRFVVPEDGRYHFDYRCTFTDVTTTTSRIYVGIRKNGTDYIGQGTLQMGAAGSVPITSVGSDTHDLVKDDYIELVVYQTEANGKTLSGAFGHTSLAGYRVVSSQDVARKTSDLTDVNAQAPSIGQALVWNGTEYVPSTVAADAATGPTSLISTFLFMGS